MPRFRDTSINAQPSNAPKERFLDPKNRVRTDADGEKQLLEKAEKDNVITAFDRAVAQHPQCQFGYQGICCRFCIQGPCRIKAMEGPGSRGICGATAYNIVARFVGVAVAIGASSRSEHGKHIAHTLLEVSEGNYEDYQITDPDKLKRVAKRLGVETEGKDDLKIAYELANVAMEDFGNVGTKESNWLNSMLPEPRKQKFKETTIMPKGIGNTITDQLAAIHMGMDADPVNNIFSALRTSLSDLNGMTIASEFSDILFGTPTPSVTDANFGVIDEKQVNIALHGHNPLLSEMVVKAAREMEDEAKSAGAEGINLFGICCTGNEVLMRQQIPLATNFGTQELVITTGAVDAMAVDVQCINPGVSEAAQCYSTKLITTDKLAKIPGSYHVDFKQDKAMECAKEIIKVAIDAYKDRKGNVEIPEYKNKLVAGFSVESIEQILSSVNSDSPWKVIVDAIEAGEISGIGFLIGCNNAKGWQDQNHIEIAKEMAKNNVLMVSTGCAAGSYGKYGFLNSDAIEKYAGDGLKKFLGRLNDSADLNEDLPLIFHMGSCVDNSRIVDLIIRVANEMDVDIPKVPVVGSAPEAMSPKAVAIGSYFLSLGVPVHVGAMPPLEGSTMVYSIATQIAHDVFGGYFILETDADMGAKKIMQALDYRTWKLDVHKKTAEKYGTSLAREY
ncbi:anaerobic carbon-monoxide dehydrogenase catalytic subunit [Natranaerofaba carboxydovora]|uniref:anaerobic carbon-monoxide dehydrogenase catalytic subunit n=1 Tax=Natranaerofaba carboxydovora TaxID=2742683 RepID=UPI001F14734A|nr:anaerobic carbon-monoxide dehydrogenase catalytic subunit [Natranaerofaba carboxydovora]UMZ75347.1 Carbon monoxide dehydrogenase/acetyl-CoA synthase subunit beta [Natranaerofaba carboxydovora]